MTAEVAILNKSAVALAADSAITVSYGRDVKVYNTLKLFSLSPCHSVGVMVYHNAEFTGVPWETIIKQYRSERNQTFPTLEEYGTDFIDYLTNSRLLFPESQQDITTPRAVRSYLDLLAGTIDHSIRQYARNGKIGLGKIKELTRDFVNAWYLALQGEPQWSSLTPDIEQQIITKYQGLFDTMITDVFQPLPLNQQIKRKLRSIAVWLLTKDLRSLRLPQGHSGIVIAGFGDNDIYPAITTFNVESLVLNQLRYEHIGDKSDRITADMDARVVAFAQEDVVTGFMEGLEPELHHQTHHLLERLLTSYAQEIVKKMPGLRGNRKKALLNAATTLRANVLTDFHTRLHVLSQVLHVQPIVRAVAALPKEELASMVDALVSLTSTKRRVTMDLETVGEPIDVAVISRGDGFVWIKRKHYFQPEKNPQFFTKYR